jgi:photosystem II stability/assembly factor-like uncharacterized protein
MKSFLLSFLFVFVLCIPAKAQWTLQHEFTGVTGIGLSWAVDTNVYWGTLTYSSGAWGYFKTTDGGTTWQDGSIANTSFITCIHPQSADVAYFGIYDGSNVARIIKTTDGGSSWVTQSSAFGGSGFYIDFIYFFDESNGVAFGDPWGLYMVIYTTTNGGDTWTRVPDSNIPQAYVGETGFQMLFTAKDNTVWVPTYKGSPNSLRIFKSTDRGLNWTVSNDLPNPMPTGSWPYPTSIAFANQNEGILDVTNWTSPGPPYYYKLMKTTDGGGTWTEMNFPLSLSVATICSVPGTAQGYVVTAPLDTVGSAFSIDGGNTWELLDSTLGLWDPRFASGTTGWTLADTFAVYEYSGPPFPVAVEEETTLPTVYALEQNYPNPFNPVTTFRYSIPTQSKVLIKVYDVLGNEIETLVDEFKPAGKYEVEFSASALTSGVYFYQLKAGEYVDTKKMILLK